MKTRTLLLILICMSILTAVGCGPAATPAPTSTPEVHEGKAIVAVRCIGCHEIGRVNNAKYDREGWQRTVDRMKLSGAQLTDEQTELVVDYLALTFPKE
jgi:mono/diheme cytochrome c family protein